MVKQVFLAQYFELLGADQVEMRKRRPVVDIFRVKSAVAAPLRKGLHIG